MSARLAVVIPAFNAEKGLERSARSVLNQTFRELELWIADDGSTDATPQIADRLAAEDSRVHVIHQANQGAYMARLNALKRIESPWFGFVDADDVVEPEMFWKMLRFAEENECDVVQCGAEGVADGDLGAWYGRLDCHDKLVLGSRAEVEAGFVKPHLERGEGASFIWNKLYRNQYDFGKFATFGRLTNYDDMIFNFQFFEKVRKMGFLSEKLYHYATTAGSATHSYGARQFDDFRACAKFRRDRGIPSGRWHWVNLLSAVVTVSRSGMGLRDKAYWVLRLLWSPQ